MTINRVTHSHRVFDSLRRLVRRYRIFDQIIRSGIGISSAQLSALDAIARSSSLSLGELAECTGTDQSSVSVVTSLLVKKGLIKRDLDPRDSRRLALRATEIDLALLQRVSAAIDDEIRAAASQLPSNERKRFAAMLESIGESLVRQQTEQDHLRHRQG